MARTLQRVRRLTLDDLGLASALPDEESRNSRHAADNMIPQPVDAPILTDIDNDRLITKPGRTIAQTAPIAGVSQYLAEQYIAVVLDLEGANTDRRTVAFFREAATLLQDWSIAKLLAFGAHLYLLETAVGPLRQELSNAVAQRVDAVVRNSRMFINNFEEWHDYVRQSVVFNIETGDRGAEVISITNAAAAEFKRDEESVDPQIPRALAEFADTASHSENHQGVAVGLMSSQRSLTNISISFVNYVSTKIRNITLTLSDQSTKLLRTICRFLPLGMRLAVIHPDLVWLLSHSDDIQALCNSLKEEPKSE